MSPEESNFISKMRENSSVDQKVAICNDMINMWVKPMLPNKVNSQELDRLAYWQEQREMVLKKEVG